MGAEGVGIALVGQGSSFLSAFYFIITGLVLQLSKDDMGEDCELGPRAWSAPPLPQEGDVVQAGQKVLRCPCPQHAPLRPLAPRFMKSFQASRTGLCLSQ